MTIKMKKYYLSFLIGFSCLFMYGQQQESYGSKLLDSLSKEYNFIPSKSGNTFIGYSSGDNNIIKNYNIFLDYGSGNYNQSGSGNVFLSYSTVHKETGLRRLYIDNSPRTFGDFSRNEDYNTFVGYQSGYSNTSGTNNIFIGYHSGIRNDSPKLLGYAKEYLGRSMAQRDTVRQADAWYFLASVTIDSIAEKYADSIISLTKSIEDYNYPAKGFMAKARILQRKGENKEALDQLLEASEYAGVRNNILQKFEIEYQIEILRNDLKEYKTLAVMRDYLRRTGQKYKEDKKHYNNYMKGLFALGNAYNRNGKYDSATIVNKKGFETGLKNNDMLKATYFTLSMGVTAYLEKRYNVALDSLQQALRILKNLKTAKRDGNLMACYLYMGKTYYDQGKVEDALLHFKKVDSIVQKTSYVFPEIRDAYELLIDYYDEKEDSRNQLSYVNRLITVDSLLNRDYEYFSKKYTTQRLNLIKNRLEIDIERLKKNLNTWIVSSSIAILFISIFAYYYYRRQRIYRIKFKALLGKNGVEKEILTRSGAATVEDLNMSETAFNKITEKLKLFIGEKRFLDNDVSLINWATAMETNPRYLSKVINFYEQKSFSVYIKELRINYIVDELKSNTTLRKYSIKAIAKEIGFNTEQSFSRSFYKKTGIYPSYFIRELEKELLKKRSA